MMPAFTNPDIVRRFDELIERGVQFMSQVRSPQRGRISGDDSAAVTQWATSCLNLLDKLSISSNRFLVEFERYGRMNAKEYINVAYPLGVLRAAREEYRLGLAVEYHLSVSATVFGSLLDEAEYLLSKGYLRAAAVLVGAALEEGLKARARAVPLEVSARDTIQPLLDKLKAPEVSVINQMQAHGLQAVARLRNDAAHGGDFAHSPDDIGRALEDVRRILGVLLSGG